MFKLTKKEAKELFSLRSQNVTLKSGQHVKYLPYAFTEHGALKGRRVKPGLLTGSNYHGRRE